MSTTQIEFSPASAPTQTRSGLRPRSRIVGLSRLSPAEKTVLLDRLIALDQQVFHETEPARVRARLAGDDDDESWAMLFEDAEGTLVGYNCIRIAHYVIDGERICCWKSRAAVLPAHRRKNLTACFPVIMLAIYRLRNPFGKIYGFIPMIHPSSFKLLADAMPQMFPFPKRSLSAPEQRVFEGIYRNAVPNADGFNLVIPTTARTRMDAEEARYWSQKDNAAVQFFLQANPNYAQGDSLASFFRIHWGLFVGIAWRQLLKRWARR